MPCSGVHAALTQTNAPSERCSDFAAALSAETYPILESLADPLAGPLADPAELSSAPNAELSQKLNLPHWCLRWFRSTVAGFSLMAVLLSGCTRSSQAPVALQLHQQWQLQPGQHVAGYSISSGLGDVVLNLGGQAVYMPKSGLVQPLVSATEGQSQTGPQCVALSSPEIPAYRLRLCHLRQLQLGHRAAGQVIGRGEQVAIAMLRKQPEGTWAFVEPSQNLLEALLTQP